MWTITHVNDYTCERLHMWTIIYMWTITHVNDYTCEWLHMWTITHVNDYTCERLHMWTITHINNYTCKLNFALIEYVWLYTQKYKIWRIQLCSLIMSLHNENKLPLAKLLKIFLVKIILTMMNLSNNLQVLKLLPSCRYLRRYIFGYGNKFVPINECSNLIKTDFNLQSQDFFSTGISGTMPRRFLLQTGSNTTTPTRHHYHHFPTLSPEQPFTYPYLPTYLVLHSLLTEAYLYVPRPTGRGGRGTPGPNPTKHDFPNIFVITNICNQIFVTFGRIGTWSSGGRLNANATRYKYNKNCFCRSDWDERAHFHFKNSSFNNLK
jgi:hypothetical protein